MEAIEDHQGAGIIYSVTESLMKREAVHQGAAISALGRSQGSESFASQTLIRKLKRRCVDLYMEGCMVAVTGIRRNTDLFYAGTIGSDGRILR